MNRWKVTTTDESGGVDTIEASDIADLARIVAASVITTSTVRVQVARSDAPPDPALLWEGRWEILKRQLVIWRDGDDHDLLTLRSVQEIMANFEVSCPAPLIAPWRQRWARVCVMLESYHPNEVLSAGALQRTVARIEREIPLDAEPVPEPRATVPCPGCGAAPQIACGPDCEFYEPPLASVPILPPIQELLDAAEALLSNTNTTLKSDESRYRLITAIDAVKAAHHAD